ncbi:Glycoside hydrolase, family 14 [Dillenia turbinata]|uniref:Beta-amylase n=1 Tax=Dillenia turbinata TaxID=194707 RepID=A0AAN8YVD8_9MAGN
MEVSMIGSSTSCSSSSANKIVRSELGFCDLNPRILPTKNKLFFDWKKHRCSKAGIRLMLKTSIRSEAANSETVRPCSGRPRSASGVKLFVGFPLDAVSDGKTINNSRAIAAGIKALKLLGLEGVELPIWWGVVEKEAMGCYEWSGYRALVEMVAKVGLKLHVSLCFHATKQPRIPLPEWVMQIGETQPAIFFKDRSGRQYKDCISLAVDDLPVLNGKSPIRVYQQFCESFNSTFSDFMGSTIMDVSMSLGPNGELRYPSYPAKSSQILSVGEFQCYDENMLAILKQHAEASGNPYWGLSGPHDAPNYDQSPMASNFFREHGGSWETPYGNFFLSWYSSQLISHGDHLLSLASSVFSNTSVTLSGKIPLMHSWYKTRSHPSELVAGIYNTINRDGYEAIAEMFARNSCKMIVPGLDLSDEPQPQESLSSPELLLAQIKQACRKHGVEFCGQNTLVSGDPRGLEQIKKNLVNDNEGLNSFTFQRMGAEFFSPLYFPTFTKLVTTLDQPELGSDDLEGAESFRSMRSLNLGLQK